MLIEDWPNTDSQLDLNKMDVKCEPSKRIAFAFGYPSKGAKYGFICSFPPFSFLKLLPYFARTYPH